VLDPDMADEVRVTVVATGLGRSVIRPSVRTGGERTEGFREPLRAPVKLVRNGSTGLADFDAMPPTNTAMPPLGLPTAGNNLGLRASSRGSEPASATALADLPADHNYLDIPAFLRRQAD
jgi:cell division protein FtsZ